MIRKFTVHILLALFVILVNAAEVDDLEFSLINGDTEYEVVNCDDTATGSLIIPTTYNELPVTSIRSYAFESTNLTNITIPESVTNISQYAFSYNSNITDIIVSNENLNYSSNYGVLFDKNQETIISYPYGKKSTVYEIPSTVTRIESSVFYGNNTLQEIVIPTSVTSIGYGAFSELLSLSTIVIPGSIGTIDEELFYGCTNLSNVTISNGITSIEGSAFSDCYSLSSVSIPNSVTSIGSYAFGNCSSLTSILIPDSVTSLDTMAFRGCERLTDIIVSSDNSIYSSDRGVLFDKNQETLIIYPAGKSESTYDIPLAVTSIGTYAFVDCINITDITIPNSVTTISSGAFYQCTSLTDVVIPNSVTSINSYAFSGCSSIVNIILPESLNSIGTSAFSKCTDIESITLPDSITSISPGLFYKCESLASVVFPVNLDSIGSYSFKKCSSLTNFSLPDSVTSIGYDAFNSCTNLTSITIPENVNSIGNYALTRCTNLEEILVSNDNESFSSINGILFNASETKIITYPAKKILDFYEVPSSVTEIGGQAFAGCTNLTNIELPDGISKIGSYAFEGCANLTSISLPESFTSLSSATFKDCASLTTVSISDNIETIPASFFENCSSLSSINLPNSLVGIVSSAFSGCSSLTQIILPETLTYIRNGAFRDCSSLTSITLPRNLNSISHPIFLGCSNLSNISVSESNSFYSSLDGVLLSKDKSSLYVYPEGKNSSSYTIPSSVNYVNRNAFHGTLYLTRLTITDNVTDIRNWAFNNNKSLTEILVSEGNSTYSSIDGVLYNKDQNGIIYYPPARSGTSYTIPNSVSSFYYSPFRDSINLKNIIFAEGTTSIVNNAFVECNSITSITIPDSVISIGASAFEGCSSLTSILIPDSVISIGSSAFAECTNLTEITIPAQVESLSYYTFRNCNSLTSIRFKSTSPPLILEGAFDNTPIEQIIVPDGITEYDIGINGIDIKYDSPVFTSSEETSAILENSGADQVIYTAQAADDSGVTYSLKPVEDSSSFSIDGTTGEVTLADNPDYESKSSYTFTVVATDAFDNISEKTVRLVINDVEETTEAIEESSSWVPVGWIYYTWPYAYSFSEGRWFFFNESDTQWRVNLTSGVWGKLDAASGWNYYAWPYSYSFGEGAWHWYNNDTQWVVDLFTGEWTTFGGYEN